MWLLFLVVFLIFILSNKLAVSFFLLCGWFLTHFSAPQQHKKRTVVSALASAINAHHNKMRKKNVLVKLQNVVGIWGSADVIE